MRASLFRRYTTVPTNTVNPAPVPVLDRLDRRPYALQLTLFVVVVLVFARVLTHPWLTYDDRFHVLDNPHLQTLGLSSFIEHARQPYGNMYIPVAYGVFAALAMLTQAVTGADTAHLSPLAFHAVQVGLHALGALLAARLFRRLGAAPVAAAIGAGLFALHPLQVESVAWLSELRGVLASVLTLGALDLYLREKTGGARRGVLAPVGAAVLFAAALLSKPSVIAMPLVFLAADMFRGTAARAAAVRALPMFVLAIGAMLLAQRLQPGETVRHAAPLWARPLVALDAVGFYLRSFLVPFGLTPDHARTPTWLLVHWRTPPVMLGMLTAAGVGALGAWAALRRHRSRREIGVCAAFVTGALAPVLGFVTFDHQDISTVADRYASLALLAPGFAIALILTRASRAQRTVWTAASLLLVAALGARSFDQAGRWGSDVSLWSHSVRINPNAPSSNNNLGLILAERGEHERAIEHFRRAVAADPRMGEAQMNLGWSLLELGRAKEAAAPIAEGVRLLPNVARSHAGAAMLAARTGDMPAARAGFQRAVDLAPKVAEHRTNLGLACLRLDDVPCARTHLSEAVRLNAGFAPAHFNLGLLLKRTGDADAAIRSFEQAVAADPAMTDALIQLGDTALEASRLDVAASAFERVLQQRPNLAEAAYLVGKIRADQGREPEARAAFERALAIDPAHLGAREALRMLAR